MQQAVRLKNGLLESMAQQMQLTTDDQLAAVIDVPVEQLDALRNGEPVPWATVMKISIIAGYGFDAREIVERIPGRMISRQQATA